MKLESIFVFLMIVTIAVSAPIKVKLLPKLAFTDAGKSLIIEIINK